MAIGKVIGFGQYIPVFKKYKNVAKPLGIEFYKRMGK